jgi:hypothetical protein
VVPLRLRHEGEELGFISTVTTFGTALDVTVSELSIEAFFPADARPSGACERSAIGGRRARRRPARSPAFFGAARSPR